MTPREISPRTWIYALVALLAGCSEGGTPSPTESTMLERAQDELVAWGFPAEKAKTALQEVIASASAEVHDQLIVRFTAEKLRDGASPAANVTEYMLEYAEKRYDDELAPELVTFFEKKLLEGAYGENMRLRVKAALETIREKMKPLLLEHLRVQASNEQRLRETDDEEEKEVLWADLQTLQTALEASYRSVAETPEVLDASRPATERLATQIERSGTTPTKRDRALLARRKRWEEPKKRAGTRAEIHGNSVEFALASAKLPRSAGPFVERAAQLLKEALDLPLEIHGHADSSGRSDTNQALGLRRARTMKAALAAAGVANVRLHNRSFGESKPKADNRTAAGRAENRRVELYVVGRAGRTINEGPGVIFDGISSTRPHGAPVG